MNLELPDDFMIRNFVLAEAMETYEKQSFGEQFMFEGFVFGVCLKGNARLRINYREYSLSENEMITILPNQMFTMLSRSSDFIIETLFLSADYVLRLPIPKNLNLIKRLSEHPRQQIQPEDVRDILEIHSLIAKYHQHTENTYRERITGSFIYALLMEIGHLYDNSSAGLSSHLSRQEVLTEQFFELLIQNYLKERSVAFYAEKLCLTPKYLSMAVKKVTGHPIIEWINEAVIIEAKRQLRITDQTVLQISEYLNFPNPSFFGRFFKQYASMTPLEYRNS
ncbi:helix-turn-helix transcriptional regulator [Bacteroides sp. 51]|uniref:AraC family transcriptional regulator n=1 Tax=Bacteroides sp. 51 TaxID=2302938 RepID=UPI0013D6219F|nr:helix-turn-helix transcriptional regulator [Bacteroides sp. 51]